MDTLILPTGEIYNLALSVEDVVEFLGSGPAPNGVVALDTETDGLDTSKAVLAGWSMALEPGKAMYVPVGHSLGKNVDLRASIDALSSYLKKYEPGSGTSTPVVPVFWNGKYDVSVFETNAGWVPSYYEDVMVLVFLENPDRSSMGLKEVAKEELGLEMKTFEQLFTPEEIKSKKKVALNIRFKSPRRCVSYASADADATLQLYLKFRHIATSFKFPTKIDMALVDVLRRIESLGGLVVNEEYVDQQLKVLADRKLFLESMIHEQVGVPFVIDSPKQLGDALFERMNIPSPGRTKTGAHKTGAGELAPLAESYPIVDYVVSYKKIVKAGGSYFTKLKHLVESSIPVRFSFFAFGAPTFRLSAPGGNPDSDGKCLAKGTKIMTFQGSFKNVESIKVNDLLMGDDSGPRTVLSLHRGKDNLYKIEPEGGYDSFVVNSKHQLCVADLSSSVLRYTVLSVDSYLSLPPESQKSLRLYHPGVMFSSSIDELPVNPRSVGLWLDVWTDFSPVSFNPLFLDRDATHFILKYSISLGIIEPSKPPFHSILKSSPHFRREFVAGYISGSGYGSGGSYDVKSRSESVLSFVQLIGRSLGYDCRRFSHPHSTPSSPLYGMSILGAYDLPPLSLKPDDTFTPSVVVDDVGFLKFTVSEVGEGRYYGFTLDCNQQYLLSSTIISHNSGVNIQAVSNGEARSFFGVSLSEPASDLPSPSLSRNTYSLSDEDNLGDLLPSTGPSLDSSSDYLPFSRSSITLFPWIWEDVDGNLVCVKDTCKGCSNKCKNYGLDLTRRFIKNVQVIPSVRKAFRAPEGYVLLSADYDREELVIGANMSLEPNWVNPLKSGEDLHAITARLAFGYSLDKWNSLPPSERKKCRSIGKMLNFATFYGATASTLSKNGGLSLKQAEHIYRGFVSRHPMLFAWMNKVRIFARKNGYVNTYFGRRRWLKQFYNDPSPGMQSFGDRSATNSIVQGCVNFQSKVTTSEGIYKIGDLCNSGKSFFAWTGFSWAPAVAVNRGPCQLAEVEFDDGSVIHCDTRHFMKGVDNEWVPFKDFTPGLYLAKPTLPPKVEWNGVKEWFYLLGRYLGDGCFSQYKGSSSISFRIVYGPTEKDEAYRQLGWLHSQGYVAFLNEKDRSKDGRQTNYILSKQNGPLIDKLLSLGVVPGAISTTKFIPSSVWTASREEQREFLQGLLDSDGAKGTYSEIWLHMQNRELLREVQILFSSLGYDTSLSKTKDAWLLFSIECNVRPDVRTLGGSRSAKIPTIVLEKALQGLDIQSKRGDCVSIVARDALLLKGKRKTVTTWMYNDILDRYNPTWPRYRYSKITKVTTLPTVEDTYTLSVDDPLHQFVADGFIHKNTGAEIMRIALVRCDNWFKNNQVSIDQARIVLTIHDELVFLIREDLLDSIGPNLVERMSIKIKDWPVQLSVGVKVGTLWGGGTDYKFPDPPVSPPPV